MQRAGREARAIDELGLPDLGGSSALRGLEAAYAAAGLLVQARSPRKEVASVQSTWAKKMAFSASERAFVELLGQWADPPEGSPKPMQRLLNELCGCVAGTLSSCTYASVRHR